MKYLILFLMTLCFFTSTVQAQDDNDWSKVNTLGLYHTPEDGQINDNIWRGYTFDKAVRTVSLMPHTLHSPAYRSAARKLLLSNAPSIQGSNESPALLAVRLQKLIDYGFFEEARTLYKKATSDIPADYNLALIGIQMILAEGDLAPACLDIQASATLFRDTPAWHELSGFCRARFGTAGNNNDREFKIYPALGRFLTSAPVSLSSFGSATETFIAFSDDKITPQFYNASARQMDKLSDLFVTLALDDKFKDNETYSCYSIEAAKRGIKNIDHLARLYQNQNFSVEDLQGRNGAVSMHPCAVPAFFYQRLNQAGRPASEIATDINLLLDVTDSLSPYAMTPMADIIAEYYTPAAPVMKDWRAALILAAAGKDIPASWANVTNEDGKTHGMAMPLIHMQQANQVSTDEYLKWVQTLSSRPEFATPPMDYALPLYYLQSLTGQFNKLEGKPLSNDYEKLFSLTYSKKYLHSSIGTIGAIALAQRTKDVPGQITIALATAGKTDPGFVNPELVAGILATFKGLKLDKEEQVLAFDALH